MMRKTGLCFCDLGFFSSPFLEFCRIDVKERRVKKETSGNKVQYFPQFTRKLVFSLIPYDSSKDKKIEL